MLHIDVNLASQKIAPIIIVFPITNHSPTLTSCMNTLGYLWILCTPVPLILLFHMPTKKKPSFAAKEDHAIDCSSKYSRKNKTQFCFIFWVRIFVKPSCPVAMLLQHSCCVSWLRRWHGHISLLCKSVPTFSLRYLQSSSKSGQIFIP